MDRKKLERKIVRTVRTYLKPGMTVDVTMDTRIIMDVGLDSMDFMLLADTLEKDFGIRACDADWNRFWSDSEVTVARLCDFMEDCRKNNLKKYGTHTKKRKDIVG